MEPIKNKIQPLQNFGLLNVEQKNCKKWNIHNCKDQIWVPSPKGG